MCSVVPALFQPEIKYTEQGCDCGDFQPVGDESEYGDQCGNHAVLGGTEISHKFVHEKLLRNALTV